MRLSSISNAKSQVCIVGGGISGLSTAYYLAKAGIPSTLIESRPRLGGVIQTERVQGCLVEAGPDSFLSSKPWAMELIQDLGLANEVIGSNDHLRKTFVWKGGRLIPLPEGLQLMVPTKVLPIISTALLSWSTKVRMGLDWFRKPKGGMRADRSVAEFLEEHYGNEAVDYLAEPLLAGIYGGHPRSLSAASVLPRLVELERKYGSLTKGVLAERSAVQSGMPIFRTLKGGLGQLIDALSSSLAGRVDVVHRPAEAVERWGRGFRIRLDGEWLMTERVVLACEAYRAAPLIASVDTALAGLLGAIPYSGSMTVALAFEQRAFAHPLEGFGFLVPKRERRRLVACTFVGTKFAHRVPGGLLLLRGFFGGMDDEAALSESDESVIASTLDELRRTLGLHAQPVFSRVFRWPSSMAQYMVGHQQWVAEIEERLAANPGLSLAGNAYYGIGIPDCVRMGKQAAERISHSSQ